MSVAKIALKLWPAECWCHQAECRKLIVGSLTWLQEMLLNLFLCHKSISDSYQHFRVEVMPHIYHSQECLHLLAKNLAPSECQWGDLMVIMANTCRRPYQRGNWWWAEITAFCANMAFCLSVSFNTVCKLLYAGTICSFSTYCSGALLQVWMLL